MGCILVFEGCQSRVNSMKTLQSRISNNERTVLAAFDSFEGMTRIIAQRRSFRVRTKGLLEKGSFQKSPFSRDSREFRDSRDS